MNWLQENALTLLMLVGFAVLMVRGPLMARMAGVEHLTVHELAKRLASSSPPLLLDVRSEQEYAGGHVQQAMLVPLPDLRQRLDEVKQRASSRPIAVICRSGNRSIYGAVMLKRMGMPQVFNVSGGMLDWKTQGYPVRP
ncbi:rhodanese-like domain-containing protein [Candidatus Magnetaquicoccus inordinatus]|uniref:rhodanese-like domain-containing protein n=1 Tax=Candidatus Magnetaquicoccus inordinatus TaxID=2496818 RepID=UPI00102BC487|nr:rhodanese-like domain-containing protein [Candidatus Magnetaquicoccus inordinatus]